GQDRDGRREVAEDELVALLGDRRCGSDIDDEGDALLLGDLGDCRGLPGIEGADEKLYALADQLLGTRTRDVDFRFGISVDDLQRWIAEILENAGGDVDAALAVLTDAGLVARPRQEHADLQRPALRAHDVERSGSREEARSAKACIEAAARDGCGRVQCARHCLSSLAVRRPFIEDDAGFARLLTSAKRCASGRPLWTHDANLSRPSGS